MKKFSVALTASNFFGNDLKKIMIASGYVEEFVNSDEFERLVLNFSFIDSNDRVQRKFHFTDLSNQEVLAKILSGSEVLSPDDDHEADIQVELDNSWSRNVIGYTYPTTPWQWIYAKFFRNWSAEEIAGNLMHEWLHKIGFDHEFYYTYDRDYSVNYALGYACSEFAKKVSKKSYFERFKNFFA